MTRDLKPYVSYQDSGLPWLGQIPSHWMVRRGKMILRCVDARSISGSEELLTVSSEHGVIPRRTAKVTMFKAESYAGYKLCWPGDLVINSLWAWGRGLGVSKNHGIVSSAYGVYRLRDSEAVLPRYIHELVRSVPFNWELKVRSKGIWISRLQLTDESFLDAPFPVPPIEEQAAIVRFLDYANRLIKRNIRAKRKLIALLNEQKEVIIHRAVTRGMDPEIQMKPSGVEWIGEVPEHWLIKPLKHISPFITVGIVIQPARLYTSAGVPCLRSLNISSGVIDSSDLVFISQESNENHRKSQIFENDIVVVRTGRAGVAVVVTKEFNEANCIDLLVVRKSPMFSSRFLATYLNSWSAKIDVQFRSVGAIQAHYNTATLASLTIPLPPLGEQESILNFISEAVGPLERTCHRLSREIGLLIEFRNRLNSDAILGKLDVREAAAQLPAISETDEALGEDEANMEDADASDETETEEVGA